MRIGGAWPASMLILGVSTSAVAAPIVDDQHLDYLVFGQTMAEIRDAVHASDRPVDASGWAHDGYLHWNVRATWTAVAADGRCHIGDVVVHLSTVTTLPAWTGDATGSKRTARQWDAYIATLGAHEDGHRAIAHQIGERLELALSSIPAVASCAAIDALAHVAIEETVAWGRAENLRYDAVTTHGIDQDAWLAESGEPRPSAYRAISDGR